MKIGDLVNQVSATHVEPGLSTTYKAPKGEVFVFLLLGTAPKDDPASFDGVKALNDLGWIVEQGESN